MYYYAWSVSDFDDIVYLWSADESNTACMINYSTQHTVQHKGGKISGIIFFQYACISGSYSIKFNDPILMGLQIVDSQYYYYTIAIVRWQLFRPSMHWHFYSKENKVAPWENQQTMHAE